MLLKGAKSETFAPFKFYANSRGVARFFDTGRDDFLFDTLLCCCGSTGDVLDASSFILSRVFITSISWK